MMKCQHCGYECPDYVQCCPKCFSVLFQKVNDPVLNLWDCRLLNVRESVPPDLDEHKEALHEVLAGLNITNEIGTITYYLYGELTILKCKLPWKNWKMDTVEDQYLFEGCMSGLKQYFEKNKIGIIKDIAITVPYSFSYLQKRCIQNIAEMLGINVLATDTAGVFYSLCRAGDNPEVNICEINCNLQDYFFEITATNITNGYCEALGTTGLEFKDRWKTLSKEEFRKRILNECRQFFRDIKYIGGERDFAAHDSVAINMLGQKNDILDDVTATLAGTYSTGYHRNTSTGAMLQCAKLSGSSIAYDILRISAQNKNIWCKLGMNGEHHTWVNRYELIPMRRTVRLKLSTETDLNIYEGNTENPAYDMLLTRISLDDFKLKEEYEIECNLIYDAHGKISLSIEDHDGNEILKSYIL